MAHLRTQALRHNPGTFVIAEPQALTLFRTPPSSWQQVAVDSYVSETLAQWQGSSIPNVLEPSSLQYVSGELLEYGAQ